MKLNTYYFRVLEWYALYDEIDQNQIFFPTLQINGGKTLERTKKYGPTDEDYFWLLFPNMLEYQQSMKVTIYCHFNFKTFPFDSQTCDLIFGSVDIFFDNLQLNSTIIDHEKQQVDYAEKGQLSIADSNLPFDFSLQSLESSVIEIRGNKFSYAGIRFDISRSVHL